MNSKRSTEFVQNYSKLKEDLHETERPQNALKIYHYTSIDTLYKLLENDEFWASNTRFSNDSSEEELLGTRWLNENIYSQDNYIICFCKENDILSQWRGYCPEGGVAVELIFPNHTMPFSILNADYEKSNKYERYYNSPLPVFYVSPAENTILSKFKILKSGMGSAESVSYDNLLKEIVPFLKNEKFHEEKELRLVFANKNSALSKCINYRNLANGSRAPYLRVRPGNISEERSTYHDSLVGDDPDLMLNELIEFKGIYPILRIPLCSNQEAIFHSLSTNIDLYNAKCKGERQKIHLLCDGHLPITRITISPMYDQKRIREQVEHFCRSKYWLRKVCVDCSSIPYVASLGKAK